MDGRTEYTNIFEYLEEHARLKPDKVAVAMGMEKYTFSEMYQKVKILSSAIACENRPVAVIADRSADTILFFLAVAYSRNFYIPIDPEMPEDKMRGIIEEAEPEYIFCGEAVRDKQKWLEKRGQLLDIHSSGVFEHDVSKITLDTPLYVIYTSGSTGKPKGVLKTHGAMISFLESYVETFGFTGDEVIGNQTPFFFDASAKDIYLMLKTGARLEIIPAELFVMPPRLIAYLNQREISYICWVPTALVLVAQMKAFKYVLPQYLTRVYFIGEVMPVKYLNYWIENLPNAEYVNQYGQSELCGIACCYKVSGMLPNDRVLPMGTPLSNCRVILRDGNTMVTETGHTGEIWISSDALAREYYKDSVKTNDSFILKDGLRFFKTGDYAYYGEEGNLIFTARQDSQIKHLGRRIELGEIEAVAGSHPDIERCCCLYDKEHKRIVLFCQKRNEMSETEFRVFLNGKLSSYMMSGKIVFMEQFPVNQNGKINRQKLKEYF